MYCCSSTHHTAFRYRPILPGSDKIVKVDNSEHVCIDFDQIFAKRERKQIWGADGVLE